ncbi:MAG: hypothetical protein AB8B57_06440 [Congregibacter sp.]
MTSLAAILIVIALADWLYQGNEAAAGQLLSLLTAASLAITAALLNWFSYDSWEVGLLTVLTVFVGILVWTRLRDQSSQSGRCLALAALTAAIAIGGLVTPALAPVDVVQTSALHSYAASYLGKLPWTQLADMSPELVFLILATLLFLGSTANAIVKTVMTLIRTGDYEESGEQLKGGRYIGPLERWLIFGLALAGQPTAAALVISAKSIIRFPELQSKARPRRSHDNDTGDSPHTAAQQIDELTEYFLIGSLLSWSLALLAALPIASIS